MTEKLINNIRALADELEAVDCKYALKKEYKINDRYVSGVVALRATAESLLEQLQKSEDKLTEEERVIAINKFRNILKAFNGLFNKEVEYRSNGIENLKVIRRFARMVCLYSDQKLAVSQKTLQVGVDGTVVPGEKAWQKAGGGDVEVSEKKSITGLIASILADTQKVLEDLSTDV